ncbi:MAG: hypothetical protein ABSF62_04730 [Bryobacteraceae bacterium]
MKKSLSGLVGTCLLACVWSLPGRAQGQRPDPQTDAQQQPAPTAQQQTPPPPAQQTPPAQQPAPTPAAPAQQQPPPEAGTQPQLRGRIPEPPPPPPKVPDVRRPGESGFFIGVSAWLPTEQPIFDRGSASTFSGDSRLAMQGKPKYAENVEVGIAAGLHNSIRLFYNSMSASGDTTPSDALTLWNQPYTAGEYLSTNYRLTNAKLSYEYLTWPYPVGSKKFRLKTLWQVQYTSISSAFDAPKNYYDSNGNLIIDPTTGNPINLVGSGTRYFISPTLGLGGHYYSSRHVRFEVNGSGFAVPHHWTIWDTDATVNFRFLGHIELRVGAKAFHFKTSPSATFYLRGTMASAIVGLRWYSNSE